MDQYPLLPLPAPEQGTPPTRRGFPPNNVPSLSPDRQVQRLGPVFQRLADVLSEDRDDLTLRNDPSSLAPERALVLEVPGSQVDVQAAIRQVKGLEFLGSDEALFDSDEDFYIIDEIKEKEQYMNQPSIGGLEFPDDTSQPVYGRLYLSMPDIAALKQLLSLWKRWQAGKALPRNFTKWRDIFAILHSIRPWGPDDRLSQETISYWQEMLNEDPKAMQRIEVEMWFHENRENRAAALACSST